MWVDPPLVDLGDGYWRQILLFGGPWHSRDAWLSMNRLSPVRTMTGRWSVREDLNCAPKRLDRDGTAPVSDEDNPTESEEEFLARLGAFVAPIADNKGAVIQDPVLLVFAQAVYEAFGDLDGTGEVLTVEQIRASCPDIDHVTFDSRVALFKYLELLRRPHGHAYQHGGSVVEIIPVAGSSSVASGPGVRRCTTR